jgi:hypothetical protein
MMKIAWKDKFRAAGIHLGLSLLVAACAGVLVFGLWYPFPFREVSGGRELFTLIVTVDIVLGPLLTFAVFSKAKAWPVMRRDLLVICAFQLSALFYGLWTVYVARPVQLLFAVDRFQVIHAVEVRTELLPKADPRITPMPSTGPAMASLRKASSLAESNEIVLEFAKGLDAAMRPDLWQPYSLAREEVLAKAKPVQTLIQKMPEEKSKLLTAASRTGKPIDQILYLPMVSHLQSWTALIDAKSAAVLDFVNVESF